MVRLAQSESGIPIAPAELDANQYQLNCLNGTIDLRTGKLHRHRREDFITKLAPIRYDPKVRDEIWEKVLSDATAGNIELRELMQRGFGYSITGDTREEVLFLIHGQRQQAKARLLKRSNQLWEITR